MAQAPTQAAGSILAGSIIAGTVGGVIMGEPSIGLVVGLGAGLVVLLAFWLRDRRR